MRIWFYDYKIELTQSTLFHVFHFKMQVEIDPDAAEKLVIGRADFLHALENDVKPAFGASQEMLETFLARGVQVWGQPVQDVLDDGHLLIQQVTFYYCCFNITKNNRT